MPGANDYAGGVALLSPCGWGNLGDAAILDSAIHAVRRRLPGVAIVGLTLNPADTAARHGIPAFTCTGFSYGDYGVTESAPAATPATGEAAPATPPAQGGAAAHARAVARRVLRATPGVAQALSLARMIRGDLGHRRLTAPATAALRFVVVAGGGQLDDFWGGSFGHPYVLWRWARHAHLTHARFVVLSVGTGTLGTRLARRFVREALATADYRSFRDPGSRALLRDWLVDADPVVPDLAYALPQSLVRPQEAPAARPVIALSPMAYCDPRAWPVRDLPRYRSYLERLAALGARLLEADHELVLYATNRSDELNVADLHAEIARRVSAERLGRVRVPKVSTVRELFAMMAGVRVVVASRLHGVLLAHVAGVPVSALPYERKVQVLMAAMKHEQHAAPIDTFDPEETFARVGRLLAARDEVAGGLATAVAGLRLQVEEQYDRVFGPPVAG